MTRNIQNDNFLILGAEGQLGKTFCSYFSRNDVSFVAPLEEACDITQFSRIKSLLGRVCPTVIINCAAYNHVDNAEEDSKKAFLVNADAIKFLADYARLEDIFFIHFSSDYVFDGEKKEPYTEADTPHPLNVYGMSKLKGEEYLREAGGKYLLMRLSWVFGEGEQNFLKKLIEWTQKKKKIQVSADEFSVPTYTEDIVKFTIAALQRGCTGLYHLTNSGSASRYEIAKYFFGAFDSSIMVEPCEINVFPAKARRPRYSVMSNAQIVQILETEIPTWQDALDRFIQKVKQEQ